MNKISTIGDYTAIADKYALDVENKPIHLYYVRPNMLSLLPSQLAHKKILDVGCGSGWYTEYLINQQCDVTAIDLNEYLINYTHQRIGGKAKVIQVDLNQPFLFLGENSFDLIIAPLVIHYINDWKHLFSGLAKLLTVNGSIIMSLPQPHMTAVLFKLENYYKQQVIEDEWDNVGKVNFYHHTLHDLFNCMYAAGLQVTAFSEPPPLQELEKADSKMYKDITTKPWFLFLRAKKAKPS